METSTALARVAPLPDELPPEQAFAMLEAMDLARRTETKRLILSRLSAVRTGEALDMAASYLDDPELQDQAVRTSAVLAVAMRSSRPERSRAVLEKSLERAKDASFREYVKRALGIANREQRTCRPGRRSGDTMRMRPFPVRPVWLTGPSSSALATARCWRWARTGP